MKTLDSVMLYLSLRAKNFFTDEEGAVDIVAIVVLIGIAVVLAVMFRGAIEDLLERLLDGIGQNAQNAVKPVN